MRVGTLRGQYHTVVSCSCCDWRHVSVSFVDRSSECGAGLSYPKPGRYVKHPPRDVGVFGVQRRRVDGKEGVRSLHKNNSSFRVRV